MYDSHIYCSEYKDLKDLIVDIVNGEADDVDLVNLENHIQELYDDGQVQATQYDDLMRYMQDLV